MVTRYISRSMSTQLQTFAVACALVAVTAGAAIRLSNSPAVEQASQPTEIAIFSGGCFWGLQAAFDEVDGVVSTRVGYTGGDIPRPKYAQVVFGRTGHAEAVEVTFDPTIVSFDKLLRFHIDRIGPRAESPSAKHLSSHSRAAVFVKSEEQEMAAHAAIRGETNQSASILIEQASMFWEAEPEHQNYLVKCVD